MKDIKLYGYPIGYPLDENSRGYLTKEEIENDGWKLTEPSPNGYLFNFEKTSGKHGNAKRWNLRYYKNDVFLAPVEICYYIKPFNFEYDNYERWSDKVSFQCYSFEDFRKICDFLAIYAPFA